MSFCPSPPDALIGNIIQQQRDRWERKRSRVARELVLSEQRYCQQLELVTTYFVEILKAKGTLRQDIRESIFSSIKAIHSVNQSLLVHLENGYFARGLEEFCTQLHHYNIFVDNIYNAQKVLWMQLKQNKAFRRFKKLQEGRPEFNNRKLEDLLQLPIERIDQSLLVHLENGYFARGLEEFCTQLHHYNIFVDNIYNAQKVLWMQLKQNKAFRRFKKLQEGRPEFNNRKLEDLLQLPIERIDQSLLVHLENGYFARGLEEFCTQLHHYNIFVDNIYNAQKVLWMQLKQNKAFRRFKKLQEGRPEFNNRKLEDLLQLPIERIDQWYIREGWLKVVPSKGSGVKPRMFFLFSDILLQAKRCSYLHPTDSEKFAGQQAYPLEECVVKKIFGDTTGEGGLLSRS
ncbi:rho guanine nucleotide exchange factor 39 [Syngnathus typhle]|uniref:rho guanine nucleotide exchange factor 39 n=1 Tax=Syngnathus typhle TaxID=161592 RepID=UPI002A69ACFF|nr:rho guanine nucleotide exchange factor 39 [Syngnathus typhle]